MAGDGLQLDNLTFPAFGGEENNFAVLPTSF
jgi:hypothetical protein